MIVRTITIAICLLLALQPLALAAESVGCCRADDAAPMVLLAAGGNEGDDHCCPLAMAYGDAPVCHQSNDRNDDPEPAEPCDCSHRCACSGASVKPPMLSRSELTGAPRAVSCRVGCVIGQRPPSGPALAGLDRPPKV